MIFLDEHNVPILLESIDIPTISEYFWTLSLSEMDFFLTKIQTFEELTTPTLIISVMGYVIELPTRWHVLACSPETSQLDAVEIYKLARKNFTLVMYNHVKGRVDVEYGSATVLDYHVSSEVRTPSLRKNTMLCHPVGAEHWICVAPTDNYNRFLKNSVIGDLY